MRVLIQDAPTRPHGQAGQVLDLPDAEATDLIRRGWAVLAPEPQRADGDVPDVPAVLLKPGKSLKRR